MTVLGGECCEDAFLVSGTTRVRYVVELFIELDRCLGCAILEASQAVRIDVQHLSDKRHVAGGVADCPPYSHPRCVRQQVVNEWSPLEASLPGHRRRIDAVA